MSFWNITERNKIAYTPPETSANGYNPSIQTNSMDTSIWNTGSNVVNNINSQSPNTQKANNSNNTEDINKSIWQTKDQNVSKIDEKELEKIANLVDNQSNILFEKYINGGKDKEALNLQEALSGSSIANIGAIGGRINNNIMINLQKMSVEWVKDVGKAYAASSEAEATKILAELEGKLQNMDTKNDESLKQLANIVNENNEINSLSFDDDAKEKLNTNLSSFISSNEDEEIDPNIITTATNIMQNSIDEETEKDNIEQNKTDTNESPTTENLNLPQNKKNPFLS